jgi:LL-diaminopimelate aminotransferase
MPARFDVAERLKRLPPYLFAEIDRKRKRAIAAGRDVIDLGVGDPDTPTPDFIVEALAEAARDPATHRYALDSGDPGFRRAIAAFMEGRFGVDVDPDSEVYPTIGSKEAIAHFPLAFVDPGDLALVPEPGYPPYRSGTIFAGGEVHALPLLEENGFLPDLDSAPEDVRKRAKLLYLNYPNSPTGVVASREFFEAAVRFCRESSIILVQDAAYAEMVYEGRALSVLKVEGAREVAVEFHSLSKTFNMTGWRVGWAAGSAELVSALGRVKTNLDSGVFTAIQRAATVALSRYDEVHEKMVALYRRRRDVFCGGLVSKGWRLRPPDATFYVWARTPEGWTSERTATRILEEADVVVTPGNGFGAAGEGYVRATLTVEESRLAEAVERMGRLSW